MFTTVNLFINFRGLYCHGDNKVFRMWMVNEVIPKSSAMYAVSLFIPFTTDQQLLTQKWCRTSKQRCVRYTSTDLINCDLCVTHVARKNSLHAYTTHHPEASTDITDGVKINTLYVFIVNHRNAVQIPLAFFPVH